MKRGFKRIASSILIAVMATVTLFTGSVKTVKAEESDVTSSYTVNSYGTGYTALFTIHNNMDTNIEDWKITVPESQLEFQSIWCFTKSYEDSTLIITPESYNHVIYANNSTSFGFNGNGTFPQPMEYSLMYKLNGNWVEASDGKSDEEGDVEITLQGGNVNYTEAADTAGVTVTDAMRERSVVSEGNTTQLAKAMAKAAKGEEVTIAYIGGSITNGSLATPQAEKCYARLTTNWWEETFPDAKINYVNAGIGATDSYLGTHRVQKDVLSYKPDVVVVEFSVNDYNSWNKETYESLLRTILKDDSNPAVVCLFLTQENFSDYQSVHQTIGEYYNLPMISYRDAIKPELENGSLLWTQLSANGDVTHPTNGGHAVIAHLLTNYYNQVLKSIDNTKFEEYVMPEQPVTASRFENGSILDNTCLDAVSSTGYEKTYLYGAQFPNGWQTTSGGTITYNVTAQNIGIIYYGTVDGTSGQFEVYIDGTYIKTIEANFVGRWGSYADYLQLADFDEKGEHTIEIKPAANTTGSTFTVLGFTVS